jgi:hypothetical protein
MRHGSVCTVALTILLPAFQAGAAKIDAWSRPLRGANYVAYEGHAAEDLPAAAAYGIRLLRLFLPGVTRTAGTGRTTSSGSAAGTRRTSSWGRSRRRRPVPRRP